MSWPHLVLAFVVGMFAASVLFDRLYRLKSKASDELIETQRDYIDVLEVENDALRHELTHQESKT